MMNSFGRKSKTVFNTHNISRGKYENKNVGWSSCKFEEDRLADLIPVDDTGGVKAKRWAVTISYSSGTASRPYIDEPDVEASRFKSKASPMTFQVGEDISFEQKVNVGNC